MNQPAPNPVPRLAWLLVAVVSLPSLAFVLPRRAAREAAIRMTLPAELPSDLLQRWKAFELEVSKAEHEKLAEDTEFEKKNYILCDYLDDRQGINGWHAVQASIVMSGHDLNDSIHRPERCLPAQGFKELKLTPLTIRTPNGVVPVSRISCYLEQPDKAGKVVMGKNGQPIRIRHVFYYWFVGSHNLTASHYERTFTDMKDRLLGGFEQRWAYVLLGGAVTDNLVEERLLGGDPAYPNGRSEAETNALLQKLVEAISREAIQWDRIKP